MQVRQGEKIAEGVAAAALCLAPLALGMVHLPAILAISALGWLALAILVIARGSAGLRLGWFGWALLAFAFLPLLQLLPLPHGFVRAIAPETARVLAIGLGPTPGARPLSLDLPATWTALAKGLGMAAVAVVLQHRAQANPAGRRRLRIYLIATTAAVVLLGLGHFLAAERQSFLGLYTFRAAHHFRVVNDLIEGHRQRGVAAGHHHAEAIAHQHGIHPGGVGQAALWIIVGRDHADLAR